MLIIFHEAWCFDVTINSCLVLIWIYVALNETKYLEVTHISKDLV